MTRTAVVDAHALIWFLQDSPKLSAEADAVMSDANLRLLLPSIALAEACWVIAKRRPGIAVTIPEVRQAISDDRRLTVVPLDEALVYEAHALPGDLEMHDRLIVATAAREVSINPDTVLVSADAQIRDAKLVPTVW